MSAAERGVAWTEERQRRGKAAPQSAERSEPANTVTGRANTAVFLAAAVLVLAALFVPGALGGVLLLVIATAAGMLLAGTWQRHKAGARAIRLVIVAALLVLAISRFA